MEDMGKLDPGMDVDGDGGDSMFNGKRCLKDEPIGIDDNSRLSITYYCRHRLNK